MEVDVEKLVLRTNVHTMYVGSRTQLLRNSCLATEQLLFYFSVVRAPCTDEGISISRYCVRVYNVSKTTGIAYLFSARLLGNRRNSPEGVAAPPQ